MENKKVMRSRFFGRILAIAMIVSLMFTMAFTANAVNVNQAVTDAKAGVVQIQVWFSDADAAVDYYLHSGTGFLINDNTVVTCQHVATGFPDSWYVDWARITNEALGGNRTAAQVKENLELRVSIYRDVYVKATVKTASTEMDYAVLSLDDTIHNRTPLKLRDSNDLRQTEAVFALGFPGDITNLDAANYFDADDVTITSGHVNKVGNMSFMTVEGGVYDSVNCVESSALITGGNSGGPLVDAEGNVVGINAVASDTRNIAVSSKQLIEVLTALGISYTSAGEKTEPDIPVDVTAENVTDEVTVNTSALSDLIAGAKEKDAKDYTEESFEAFEKVLRAAETALASGSQAEVDSATANLEDAIDALEASKSDSSFGLIGIIILVVVLVVILLAVIILIVVISKKKKAQSAPAAPATPAARPAPAPVYRPAPAPSYSPAPAPQARPAAPSRPATPTRPTAPGAWETTVLDQGAGETTVLSQNANGGCLIRISNNERIQISSEEFSIGRDSNSVDYCVSGNSNISRVHARFVVRHGTTYIVDNKAANGTFVNGVKARAGQEIELKNGDKVLLADEKFEYRK